MSDHKNLVKRYLIFFLGLLLNSFGVAVVTKGMLGTSPIASIPYSLSLIIPRASLGNWTIAFSLLLIVIQIILLKKDAKKVEIILQIAISFVFGHFIDLSMSCLNELVPSSYPMQLFSLVLGCCIIAFGAYFEVIADVVMLPGDAFVRAIAKVTSKGYGTIRVISDMSMTITAGVICLLFLHELQGVREGTIIAAAITGNIVKVITKKCRPLTRRLLP